MDISLIISLAVALLGAIAVIVTMYRKLKKALGDLIKDGGWKKLFPIILNAIAEAEATGKTGAEKKEIVMAAVDSFASQMGIQYEVENLSKLIDEIVEISSKINIKEEKENGANIQRNLSNSNREQR